VTSLDVGPTDRLFLGYTAVALVTVILAPIDGWLGWVAFHLLTFVAVLLLARGAREGPVGWLHLWYPVLSFPWLYREAGALRHVVVPVDLDAIVRGWDAALFPAWYAIVPPRLPVAVLEGLHAVYFSYYLLLVLPGMVAGRSRRGMVREYVFVLTAVMLAHYVAAVLFPVAGPVALRPEVMPSGWLFVPLMDHLYGAFDRGGLAFPSTHAAAALIAGVYAARFFPRRRAAFAIWVLVILVSTVLCSYHYTVDTLAGVVTGAAGLWAGRALWQGRVSGG